MSVQLLHFKPISHLAFTVRLNLNSLQNKTSLGTLAFSGSFNETRKTDTLTERHPLRSESYPFDLERKLGRKVVWPV